jgi:hypothetical protein
MYVNVGAGEDLGNPTADTQSAATAEHADSPAALRQPSSSLDSAQAQQSGSATGKGPVDLFSASKDQFYQEVHFCFAPYMCIWP